MFIRGSRLNCRHNISKHFKNAQLLGYNWLKVHGRQHSHLKVGEWKAYVIFLEEKLVYIFEVIAIRFRFHVHSFIWFTMPSYDIGSDRLITDIKHRYKVIHFLFRIVLEMYWATSPNTQKYFRSTVPLNVTEKVFEGNWECEKLFWKGFRIFGNVYQIHLIQGPLSSQVC